MIVVISDDITGAAELGGIALRYGLNTIITTDITNVLPHSDILIIATDTRSDTESGSVKAIKHLMCKLKDKAITIYKKTDSVLRGHIIAEIKTIISYSYYRNALLLPQNPSKGRIIKDGIYYIYENKLDKTEFRNDPEYPILSSNVNTLLNNSAKILNIDDITLSDNNIYIANAQNENDIIIQLSKAHKHTLLSGGADFFNCIIKKEFNVYPLRKEVAKIPNANRIIIVCGSTQSYSLVNEPYITEHNGYEAVMPDDVFNGHGINKWIIKLKMLYDKHETIILNVGKRENRGKEYAVRLKRIMAEATKTLVKIHQPDILIIEGGATAYSIIQSLKWYNLEFKTEYSPGIVSMLYDKTEIILKPGSYSWNDIFKSNK